MNLELENEILRKKLDDTLERLKGAQLNTALYFLIGMANYLPRSSGAGTPAIPPPPPVQITCPHCGQKI